MYEAGELLGDSGQGDKPNQSWLIHLAGRQRVKWVQDDIPPKEFPFQKVGWRETDGTDSDWWAVILQNVLNLSVKALREFQPARRQAKVSDPERNNLDQLQRRIVALHRPNTSNASTAEAANADAEIRRLAKELGKTLDADIVQSCRTALRQKANRERKRP